MEMFSPSSSQKKGRQPGTRVTAKMIENLKIHSPWQQLQVLLALLHLAFRME